MSELVSVVVPVYNVLPFLKRCLDSIICQTYSNLEIIIVDDGSTDGSGLVCDEYKKKDSRIKVIHRENGGLSEARNTGIEIFNGKYITFIDSDDWIEPSYVEYLYTLISENKADMVQCAFRYIDSNHKVYNKVSNTQEILVYEKKQATKDLLLTKHLFSSAWGKLYQRRFFEYLRYPKGKLFEDIPVTYDVVLSSNIIVYGDIALYNYYYNNQGISKAKFNPRRLDVIEFISGAVDKVVQEYPELKLDCDVAMFRTYLGVFLSFDENTKYGNIEEEIWQSLKKYRQSVINNSDASKVIRIKALSTYLGKNFVKKRLKR